MDKNITDHRLTIRNNTAESFDVITPAINRITRT